MTTTDRVPAPVEADAVPLLGNAVAIVPDMSMYDTYISRKVGGVKDMDMLEYARITHSNVLLEGPTGAGKTSASMAFAAKNNMPFYATPSSIGIEPSQLFGRFIPDGKGGFEWQDGPVTYLVRNGGLLLINEINFIPARVSTVLFSLLDKRRTIQLLDHKGEVLTAHEDLMIVADMNPDYRGTTTLNAALRNRFAIQQYWDYDPVIERRLVPHPEVIEMAKKLRNSEEIGSPVSSNMLRDFVTHAQSPLGWNFAKDCFVSKFTQDERAVVGQMIDLHSTKLKAQILKVADKKALAKDDEPEWDYTKYDLTKPGTKDNPNPIKHPEWQPDWGVYITDWSLEEYSDDEEQGA